MFGKQGTSCRGSTSWQTMEACHSCSDTRGTYVFSWPLSTNARRLSWNTVSSFGSRSEAVAVPNTLADVCGREVTVFHFVGGATLVEASYAHLRRLPRRHETEEARDAPALQPGVSHVEWRLDGCDIVKRADPLTPDVFDHFIWAGNALHGVGARRSFMERYLKTTIIEEKWHQKRKQEAEERSLQKKGPESTSEEEEAPDSHAVCQSQRSQSGYDTAYLEFRTNFDEAFVKFDAFLAALNIHKMMVARGLWEKYADMMRKDFRSTELQMQSTVVHHANKIFMDKLEQHSGELPDDQFEWVLLRLIVPTRYGSSWLVRKLSDINNFGDHVARHQGHAGHSKEPGTAEEGRGSACNPNPKGKAKGKAKVLSVAPVAAASLVGDMVGTIRHFTGCLADTTSTSAQLANKLMLLCVEFALEGKVSCLERPALQVILATSDVKLAYLKDPVEALCKLGNATLALCEGVHWLELLAQVHQNVRVHAAHTEVAGGRGRRRW